MHDSRAAVVAGATAAAAKLPPRAAVVAMKTPAATAMAGAQAITNNQLKLAATTATKMATMTAATTNENKGDNDGGRSLVAVRRRR